jgi:nitronate monooxygenase
LDNPNTSTSTTTFHTSLCQLMNIRYPIVQAGMAGSTTPELVAAVSNAGGLGILGVSKMTPPQFQDSILAIKQKTKYPFGVNLLLAPPEQDNNNKDIVTVQQFLDQFSQKLQIPSSLDNNSTSEIRIPSSSNLQEQLKIILDEHVPLLSIGMGDPSKIIKQAHAADAKVMSMITTVEEAVRLVEGGTDIVVAQEAEAGGHRSTFQIDPNSALSSQLMCTTHV